MRHRILCTTRMMAAAMLTGAAALLLSTAALAGTPTLGAGCGSGANIVGSDTAGKITLGTGSGVCVLSFSTAFANAPACMAMNETNGGAAATAAGVKSTPTNLTVAVPWADGDVISYICSSY